MSQLAQREVGGDSHQTAVFLRHAVLCTVHESGLQLVCPVRRQLQCGPEALNKSAFALNGIQHILDLGRGGADAAADRGSKR